MFICAGHVPVTASQMILFGEAIPDRSMIAKVVKGIHMGAAVRVHGYAVTRVSNEFIMGLADLHRIVAHGSARSVRHPYLERRIASTSPRGHINEVVDC